MNTVPICIKLEEIAMHAGHKVLLNVDSKSALILDDPHEILGQQLRPHSIHSLNITVLILIIYNIL